MIYVVGLGCKKGQLTLEGAEIIAQSKKVFVKTAKTDTYGYFEEKGIGVVTFDDIYENSEDFDSLDENIVDILTAQKGSVCYCVNGSGFDDTSVALLCKRAKVKIIPGVSRPVCAAGTVTGAVYISAYTLLSTRGFDYDTRLPLVITDVDDKFVCSEVKLVLEDLVGADTPVLLSGKETTVAQLDHGKRFDYSSTIAVPPLQLLEKSRFNFVDVVEILRRLRDENGCKWDRAQTHESIRANMVEEAYELVEAINNEDVDNMIEETGDVLLQAVFHSEIGEDCGEYNVHDVTTGLCRKLIDRHEHVFGNVVANTAEEGLKAWENAKAKEKHYKSYTQKMDKIARTLPALMRAYKIQKTAAKAGMDFESAAQAADKLQEEIKEFFGASEDRREDEGGDLLFAAVNVLRLAKTDPEIALIRATEKFAKRFCYVEEHCSKPIEQCSAQELDLLWEQAKHED